MKYEKTLTEATLIYVRRDNEVLLARKMRHIGAGCLSGYGGGLEDAEEPEFSAARELFAESGIVVVPEDLEKIAEVHFKNTKTDGTTVTCKCHVYVASIWEREPHTTDEMADPRWYPIDNLPLKEMMPGDPSWLPLALGGKKLIATVRYGPFQKELLGAVRIREVDDF